MASATARFFSALPIHRVPLSRLFGEPSRFADVPRDWHVIVTDVEHSTEAVMAGRHDDVNLVATGSIIAALNLAYRADLDVPFFFGGDGAILLVPPALREPVLAALAVHRANTRRNFELALRVGEVPVAALDPERHALRIARLAVSDVFSIPVVLGHGLAEAERRVKGAAAAAFVPADELDLDGMECRWEHVQPSRQSHEVVSLLVTTPEGEPQAPVFQRVVELIDDVYGAPDRRNPISLARLRLNGTVARLGKEMRARLGRSDPLYLLRTWVETRLLAPLFFRTRPGRQYLERLVDLTDTLVVDGRISTVVAGTAEQRERLETGLDALEREGRLHYGLAVSRESVVSCYVRDRTDKHIHFVDGADGGYTLAAVLLKQKRQAQAAS